MHQLPARKGSAGFYPQLCVNISCSRNPTFVLFNIILIMFLLVCFFFISVFTPSFEAFANRNQLAAALVLTAVALKVLTSDKLPDLPYLTFLDKYGYSRKGGSLRTTLTIPEKEARPKWRLGPKDIICSHYIFWSVPKIEPLNTIWKCWKYLYMRFQFR